MYILPLSNWGGKSHRFFHNMKFGNYGITHIRTLRATVQPYIIIFFELIYFR